MTSPIDNPSAFDTFTLDGVVSPGLSKIASGGGREEGFQNVLQPGFIGQFTRFLYELVSVVEYTVQLWAPEHFAAWTPWVGMINEGKDRRPMPRLYTIADVRLEDTKITTVAFAFLGPRNVDKPGGPWSHSVKFAEFRKMKPFGGVLQAPQTQAQKDLAAITTDNQGLAARLAALQAAHRQGR